MDPARPGTGTTGPGPGTKSTTPAKNDRRPRRKQRLEMVLINPGESKSSGDVRRALRSGLHPEELGLGVKAVRSARKGGLLIEFEGSVKDRSALGNKITEVAGEDVEVRHLAPTATLVIDGMDFATTVEEVKAALAEAIGETADGLNVSITKPNKWGSVRAFIEAGIGAAAALETLGEVKVGWLPARAGQGRTGAVAAGGVVRWITSQIPVPSLCAAISVKRWEAGKPLITWRVLDGVRPIGRYSKRKMAKKLQVNLHRCKLVLDLLYARNRDNGMDIVLVSEQYHSVSGPNCGARDGIVWVETPAVTFVSCYFTFSEPSADFRKKVDNLERVVRHLDGEIVIGGNFNAKGKIHLRMPGLGVGARARCWCLGMSDSEVNVILQQYRLNILLSPFPIDVTGKTIGTALALLRSSPCCVSRHLLLVTTGF
ncbi:Protein of unknown function [Cotesia congregata]|uniref:Endonuclease/exonuclease/phosphatase domain-containing protein n=1 Tax=Cotesia congregata TaxID=51543 RepID=A0A8J2H2P4_COTCN|nr:Protein of unknown function [Cotesia congregata]